MQYDKISPGEVCCHLAKLEAPLISVEYSQAC
jgi:hypothetical protein